LKANLLSPQLRQAMHTLTQAIQSDQAEIIISSCGLDSSSVASSKDGMEALIKAFVDKHSTEKEGDEKKDDKADKKDEDMNN